MLQRRFSFPALGAGLLLTLTACGGDSGDGGGAAGGGEPTASASAASPSTAGGPATGWRQHGGPTSGFTIGLPPGWQIIDPTTATSDAVRTAFGLKGGELPELVEDTLGELKKHNAVFAIETASEATGYANHLTAVCGTGGVLGNDLETLRRKARALNSKAQNLQITDVTVAGKQGIRISYTGTKSTGVTENEVEIQVPGTGDNVCEAQLTSRQGAPAKDAERILATFKPV
jgi:hypothetical protein